MIKEKDLISKLEKSKGYDHSVLSCLSLKIEEPVFTLLIIRGILSADFISTLSSKIIFWRQTISSVLLIKIYFGLIKTTFWLIFDNPGIGCWYMVIENSLISPFLVSNYLYFAPSSSENETSVLL